MNATPSYIVKRVPVTGGTGSFGKVVAKGLPERGVEEARSLSRCEARQHDMRVLSDEPLVPFGMWHLAHGSSRRVTDNFRLRSGGLVGIVVGENVS